MVVVDVVAGLLILAALAAVVAYATTGRARAAAQFGHSREAVRSAERALVDLRLGRPIGKGVTARPLDTAGPAPGLGWVEVTATREGRSATLVGAVPIAPDAGAASSASPATAPATRPATRPGAEGGTP